MQANPCVNAWPRNPCFCPILVSDTTRRFHKSKALIDQGPNLDMQPYGWPWPWPDLANLDHDQDLLICGRQINDNPTFGSNYLSCMLRFARRMETWEALTLSQYVYSLFSASTQWCIIWCRVSRTPSLINASKHLCQLHSFSLVSKDRALFGRVSRRPSPWIWACFAPLLPSLPSW